MEAQDGSYIGIQILMDHYGSRYCTYKNVSRRLENFGLEGEDKNPIVSLRFNITESVRGRYNQGIMG
jgi:hypothetical protein